MIHRSLRLRPQRFWVAVLSVSMGAAVAVAIADLSLVFGDRLSQSLRAYGANLILVPEGSSMVARVDGTDFQPAIQTAVIAESSLVRIHKSYWRNNILGYAPRLAAIGRLDSDEPITVVGTWFSRDETTPDGHLFTAGMTTVAPWWEVEGRLPGENTDECLVGRTLLDRLGLTIGDELAPSN